MKNEKNDLCHELNTPLTTIFLRVELIKKELEASLSNISVILEAIEKQKKVIMRLK